MDTPKDGKTPDLSAQEQREVDKNQPPRAAVLHEIIRTQGDKELERSVAALWWSALAAGLTMGLSLMGMGLLNSRLPDSEGFKVIASFGYCAGFLAVILARQQLFTENTLTAVLPIMSKPTLGNFGRLFRLWSIVLVGNLCGTLLVAYVMLHLPIFDAKTDLAFLDIGRKVMENDASKNVRQRHHLWLDDRHHGLDDPVHGKRQDVDHHPHHLFHGAGRLHSHRGRIGRGLVPGVCRRVAVERFLAGVRGSHASGEHHRWQFYLRADQSRADSQ